MPRRHQVPKSATFTPAEIARLARPCVQVLKPYVPGRSIEQVREQYHPPRIVKLGSNENPLGANPRVRRAVARALPDLALYPDGSNTALRRALARAHGLDPGQVMAGNGSDEVLLLIALAFLRPGDRVAVSESTFSEYEFAGRVQDARVVKIPLRDLRYDLPAFARAARRCRMLFLCNPNNPTGTYFTHAELERLLRAAPRRCLVVVDEAYGEYATARDFPRSLELMRRHPNLLVARTFSKAYGMAGLRVGYGFGDAGLIRETLRVKSPFNLNRPAQAAALAALEDKAFLRRSLAVNRRGKSELEKAFRNLGLRFLPTQANFICFQVPGGCEAVPFCEALMRRGVIIRPLASFDLPLWCRVTVGTAAQNRFFLRALKKELGR